MSHKKRFSFSDVDLIAMLAFVTAGSFISIAWSIGCSVYFLNYIGLAEIPFPFNAAIERPITEGLKILAYAHLGIGVAALIGGVGRLLYLKK